MSAAGCGLEGFPLGEAIGSRAAAAGIVLSPASIRALASHARDVLSAPAHLHLTAVTEPGAFVERHLGEAFEGAALLEAGVRGVLLDLGSGNGYPGLPVCAARPGLRPVLAEASARKAAFLREALRMAGFEEGEVVERRVQRPADLGGLGAVQVLATRAMGGWEGVLPRLVPCLSPGGRVLLWAGRGAEAVLRRAVWGRLEVLERRPLPGRERSWVWLLAPVRTGR